MPSRPRAFLFGDDTIATATEGQSAYGHTFGGPHDRAGASREACGGILIHLLHRLDLTDPAVPIRLPGLRWLPFYYCFDFRANALGYRLLSEDALLVYFPEDDPNVSEHEAWPDDDYPSEFARRGIEVAPYPYDPTNLEDAYAWAGIFGIGNLSAVDQAAAKDRLVRERDALGLWPPETEEEFREALSGPFPQGMPDGTCLNPGCPDRSKAGVLSTIAVIPAEPVKGVHTFGRWGSGVMLIVQICKRCQTIRVTNQCD